MVMHVVLRILGSPPARVRRLLNATFAAAPLALVSLSAMTAAASTEGVKPYRIIDGRVDARTYNGFRRYGAACNHCHGPDGTGSSFAPSLIEDLPPPDEFRASVLNGLGEGNAIMNGFARDPNIARYVDDIYSYLRARADGALGRGRPARLDGQ
ncbi:MAG TPA: cytochrome c [Stellaceae bacterium]